MYVIEKFLLSQYLDRRQWNLVLEKDLELVRMMMNLIHGMRQGAYKYMTTEKGMTVYVGVKLK